MSSDKKIVIHYVGDDNPPGNWGGKTLQVNARRKMMMAGRGYKGVVGISRSVMGDSKTVAGISKNVITVERGCATNPKVSRLPGKRVIKRRLRK